MLFYKKQVVHQEVDNTLNAPSNATISEHNETLSPPASYPKDPDNDSVSSSDVGSFIKLDQFDNLDDEEMDTMTSHQGLIQT